MLDNGREMVVIHYSRSAIRRFIARTSAILLVCAGFFAILFVSTPRAPGGTSAESVSFITSDIARADAPSCSCGSDSAGCGDSGCGGCGDSGCGCGSLICTELFRQGLLSPAWYEADERFGKLVPAHIREGYQIWARVAVRLMRRSRLFTAFIGSLAKPWAQQMAYEMGVAESGSRVGRMVMFIGTPICSTIGSVLKIFRRSHAPHHIG